ncbi:MAG: Holliday junction resolvase RuvX [Phycisphaerae bacterium]|nr:Holliday junction resolvase RuvX [Phycisphaerae bacterium]
MRYLAIDYGLKRIGLAHCDPAEIIVGPFAQIDVDSEGLPKVFNKLINIIKENQFEAIVLGLPVNMDGSEGYQAKLTRDFAEQLCQKVAIPVHFQDERLSSSAADEMLAETGFTNKKRKARRDALAACEILRDWLGM